MAAAHCPICALHSSTPDRARYEIARGSLWLLRHHPDPSPLAGWLLLDARRHLEGPLGFSAEEASGWGGAVQAASQLVQQLTGCERVYAIAFGEGAHHLHLHLIPRHLPDPASCAWSVADLYRAVERSERPAADPQAVAELVQRARLLLAANPCPALLGSEGQVDGASHNHALVAVDDGALAPPATAAAGTMALLARRSPERLNQELWRRLESRGLDGPAAAADDPADRDTDIDLLIDRLHDLAERPSP
jgi:diadenosine tetraphosphate (Ap4A) HIT family hydrolase